MSVMLLTDHNLEFLSLKGGCTGSSESTLVKMPHCWRLHVAAHIVFFFQNLLPDQEYVYAPVSNDVDAGPFFFKTPKEGQVRTFTYQPYVPFPEKI